MTKTIKKKRMLARQERRANMLEKIVFRRVK